MLALHAALFGRGGRRVADEIGQAGKIGFAVELHGVGLLVGQYVLAERGAKRRQPLDDRRQALLLIGIKGRATQGVTLFRMEDGERVVSVERIADSSGGDEE